MPARCSYAPPHTARLRHLTTSAYYHATAAPLPRLPPRRAAPFAPLPRRASPPGDHYWPRGRRYVRYRLRKPFPRGTTATAALRGQPLPAWRNGSTPPSTCGPHATPRPACLTCFRMTYAQTAGLHHSAALPAPSRTTTCFHLHAARPAAQRRVYHSYFCRFFFLRSA